MVPEARLERVASGLAPVTPGWFVVNTADAAWVTNDEWGGVCIFESDDFVLRGRPDLTEYVKPDAGFTIRVVQPGKAVGLYHAESVQEDFLILMRRVPARHRGAGTSSAHVGLRPLPADDRTHVRRDRGRAVRDPRDGNRRDDLERMYPRSEVALRHGAGSEVTTADPERRGQWEVRRPARWDDLPWADTT